METNLLPISQIANLTGTDKIHLAYLTKLRLIPQTIRRKVNGKIAGCYPSSVVETLKKIEVLKNQGLPYSQIRYMLNREPENFVPATLPVANSPVIAFLLIGLILGYILASLPKQPLVPSVVANAPKDLVFSIAIPANNLYKLGKISL